MTIKMEKKNRILDTLSIISSNEFFCGLLLIYMIILIVGTLSQKDFGLQFVQEKYFTSNIIWLNNKIPFIGGRLVLIIIFISLFLRLLFDKLKKRKIGILLLHVGVLILLFGAFICEKYNTEGYLTLREGEQSNFFTHKNLYELILVDKYNSNRISINLTTDNLIKKYMIDSSTLIQIKNLYKNCNLLPKRSFFKRKDSNKIDRFFNLIMSPMFVESENNSLALNITVYNKNGASNFSFLEKINTNNSIFENERFDIFVVRKNVMLPFNIHLLKFIKHTYPGTNTAMSYESRIIVTTQSSTWKANIEMNKPFRFMGYTFYQSSFINDGFERATVLSVVKNIGRNFPYISVLIIFLGFIIHLFLSMKRLFRY